VNSIDEEHKRARVEGAGVPAFSGSQARYLSCTERVEATRLMRRNRRDAFVTDQCGHFRVIIATASHNGSRASQP
jgi:hypothetical protein